IQHGCGGGAEEVRHEKIAQRFLPGITKLGSDLDGVIRFGLKESIHTEAQPILGEARGEIIQRRIHLDKLIVIARWEWRAECKKYRIGLYIHCCDREVVEGIEDRAIVLG